MQMNKTVRRTLFAAGVLVSALSLSSGTASAATPTTSHAASTSAFRPAECASAVTPDANGREVYNYTGRLITPSGSFFEYLGDAGDYFYSENYMGETFVRFCI